MSQDTSTPSSELKGLFSFICPDNDSVIIRQFYCNILFIKHVFKTHIICCFYNLFRCIMKHLFSKIFQLIIAQQFKYYFYHLWYWTCWNYQINVVTIYSDYFLWQLLMKLVTWLILNPIANIWRPCTKVHAV